MKNEFGVNLFNLETSDDLFDEIDQIPYYDSENGIWKFVTENGIEEGSAIYIAGEIVSGGLYYPFHS